MNILVWQISMVSVLTLVAVSTSFLRADSAGLSTLVSTVHGFTCALWLGASFWAASFQGLTMMQVMPRHVFGRTQGRVFPVLFKYGNVCTSLALLTFLYQHPVGSLRGTPHQIQAAVLLASLLGSLVNTVWLVPRGVESMYACHKAEREVGLGNAVCHLDPKPLEGNRHYQALRYQFILYHTASTVTAIISCMGVAYRVAYLSGGMNRAV